MAGFSGHLVRRGLSVARDQLQQPDNGEPQKIKVSGAGLATISCTVLLFLVAWFAIRYTYGELIPVLAMVESPETDVLLEVDNLEDADPARKLIDPDVVVLKTKPITAKIRTTILHLRAKAGYLSRFRGASLFIIYQMVAGVIVNLIMSMISRSFPARLAATFIAEVLLCRFEMTWVHIVISEPSALRWYKRVPRGWKPFKSILPAAILKSAATQIVVILPAAYACNSKLSMFHDNATPVMTQKDAWTIILDAVVVVFMYFTLAVLIEIPAVVTFVRVAASMLPEHDEAIVPFDRTFNGKVTPEIIGGAGKVGIVEAWRSFDRSSRIRLLKLVVKVVLIQIAFAVLAVGVFVAEFQFFAGEQIRKIIEDGKAGGI